MAYGPDSLNGFIYRDGLARCVERVRLRLGPTTRKPSPIRPPLKGQVIGIADSCPAPINAREDCSYVTCRQSHWFA
jgi:hypothetical protein